MALSLNLIGYNPVCAALASGVARAWIFDPEDFDFTQAVPDADGSVQPYTAVALRTGATALLGAKMFPIGFSRKEAEYTYKQSLKNGASKYEHQLELSVRKLTQGLANFSSKLDAASVCGGVGVAFQLNDGTIFVSGERFINGAAINIPFDMVQDGSSGGTGKELDDKNGATIILKGDANRMLYEYTGGVQSLITLQGA